MFLVSKWCAMVFSKWLVIDMDVGALFGQFRIKFHNWAFINPIKIPISTFYNLPFPSINLFQYFPCLSSHSENGYPTWYCFAEEAHVANGGDHQRWVKKHKLGIHVILLGHFGIFGQQIFTDRIPVLILILRPLLPLTACLLGCLSSDFSHGLFPLPGEQWSRAAVVREVADVVKLLIERN